VRGFGETLDPSTIRDRLSQANVTSWIRQGLSLIDFQRFGMKVFVDGSGLLRRLTLDMMSAVASSGNLSVDETLDFSDYGRPVSVSAPSADQVMTMDQFLQSAGSSSSS
jgi:hypothetical protein